MRMNKKSKKCNFHRFWILFQSMEALSADKILSNKKSELSIKNHKNLKINQKCRGPLIFLLLLIKVIIFFIKIVFELF